MEDQLKVNNGTDERLARKLVLPLLGVCILVLWGAFLSLRENARFEDDYYRFSTRAQQYVEGYAPGKENPDLIGRMISNGFIMQDLNPGDYTLTLEYDTDADGNWFEVVDTYTGDVLTDGVYDPESTELSEENNKTVTVDFYTTEKLQQVQINSYLEEGKLTLISSSVKSLQPVYSDSLWIIGSAAMLVMLILYYLLNLRKEANFYSLILLLAAILLIFPYIGNTLSDGHDLRFHLSRIQGIDYSLRFGYFPARMNASFLGGGGYVVDMLYPELFLYIPALMCYLGASVLCAYKLFVLLINIATVFLTFYACRQVFRAKTGFWCALVYLLFPYRLTNLYVRAAFGEFLAMTFLPFALIGVCLMIKGKKLKGAVMSVVGITGIVQSHILSIFLFLVFAVPICAVMSFADRCAYWRSAKRIATTVFAALMTVGLNLWFLIPFIDLKRKYTFYLAEAPTSIYKKAVDLKGLVDGTYNIGWAFVLGTVLFLLILYRNQQAQLSRKEAVIGTWCVTGGIFCSFLASVYCPWPLLQQCSLINNTFGYIQFSWRILGMAGVFLAIPIGIALGLCHENKRILAMVLVLAALLVGVDEKFRTYRYDKTLFETKESTWDHNQAAQDYCLITNGRMLDSASLTNRFQYGRVRTEDPSADISDVRKEYMECRFRFTKDPSWDTDFDVPLYCREMHSAHLDTGEALNITIAQSGGLLVSVPKGVSEGTVYVVYDEPLLYRCGNYATLAFVLLGLAVIVLANGIKKRTVSKA